MYDLNEVSIKHPAHFTNDLRCRLFICIPGSYRLLLGAIIMMGGGGAEKVSREGILKIYMGMGGINFLMTFTGFA